jgi:hypothetical protein
MVLASSPEGGLFRNEALQLRFVQRLLSTMPDAESVSALMRSDEPRSASLDAAADYMADRLGVHLPWVRLQLRDRIEALADQLEERTPFLSVKGVRKTREGVLEKMAENGADLTEAFGGVAGRSVDAMEREAIATNQKDEELLRSILETASAQKMGPVRNDAPATAAPAPRSIHEGVATVLAGIGIHLGVESDATGTRLSISRLDPQVNPLVAHLFLWRVVHRLTDHGYPTGRSDA